MRVLTNPKPRMVHAYRKQKAKLGTRRPMDVPLTDEQRDMITSHWLMIQKVIGVLVEGGRIRRQDWPLAEEAAGRQAIISAKSYDPTVCRFSTYLWNGLARYLPQQVMEERQAEGKAIARKADFARSKLSIGIQAPGLRPDEEAASREGEERIQALLEECEAELPGPGADLRRWLAGETTNQIGRSRGVTGRSVQQRIQTARNWIRWRLEGKAK